jgi:hypothetical protein
LGDVYHRLDSGTPGAKRAGGFVNPTNAPGSTGYTLDEIMARAPATNVDAAGQGDVLNGKVYWSLKDGAWGQLVGTSTGTASGASASVPKTGQTNSYQVGDDGDYKKGATWPSPRFTAGSGTSSNCVTDNLTGLIWVRNPSASGLNWSNALAYCDALDGANGRGGLTDWRLPNWDELRSLLDASQANPALPAGHPFSNIQVGNYWSSSVVMTTTNADQSWFVNLSVGNVSAGYRTLSATVGFVWPVYGVTWPKSRFSVGVGTSSNCVTDNLTGLVWLKNPSAAGMSWSSALTYCEALDGADGRGGFTDWRLPNWNELRSLIDSSQANPALPVRHPFTGVLSSNYWSSTTVATNATQVWLVDLGVGRVNSGYKTLSSTTTFVWPVYSTP